MHIHKWPLEKLPKNWICNTETKYVHVHNKFCTEDQRKNSATFSYNTVKCDHMKIGNKFELYELESFFWTCSLMEKKENSTIKR